MRAVAMLLATAPPFVDAMCGERDAHANALARLATLPIHLALAALDQIAIAPPVWLGDEPLPAWPCPAR